MINLKFNKTEVMHLLVVILILGFVFSFKEWGTEKFDFSYGLLNFLRACLAIAFALILRELFRKLVAKRFSSGVEYRIWNMRRYGFAKGDHLPKPYLGYIIRELPIGLILALVLVFISNGNIIFAAVGMFIIQTDYVHRLGNKFKHLTGSESAIIALSGPMFNLFLALLFKSIPGFEKFVVVNFLLALYSMIPFSNLDGTKILFGSRIIYIFSLIFMIFTYILSFTIGVVGSIILAFFAAIIIVLIYLYKSK